MNCPYFCSKASTSLFSRSIWLPSYTLVTKRPICLFTSKQHSILNYSKRFCATSIPKQRETTMLYRRHFNVQPLHEHICGSFDAYIFQVNGTGEIIFQLYIRSNNGRLWMSLGGLKKLIEGLEEVHQTVLENEAHVLEFRRNADDVLYEEKFVDEVRNRLITFKLVVSYGKHPFPNTAGDMILDITTENLKDPSKGSFIPLGIFPGSNAILNLKNNLEELLKAHEDRQWELRAHEEEQNRVE